MLLVAPATLEYLLRTGSTLALIDVREHGEYNAAHIAGASSVPRRQLEHRMARLVPFRGVQVVVSDDDGRRGALAARTLERMGYERVAVLDGGLNRWASEGLPTEWGMNVPSKDFGEKVEVVHHVPTIEPRELDRRRAAGERLLILDTRTPEEFRRACIPGGRSVPGGELAYRVSDIIAQQPDATVVVNCAGRTRSIIGARTLQRMGVPNVVSLNNGTSGWVLAGLQVEHGADRAELPEPSSSGREKAEAHAARLAAEDGVQSLLVDDLQSLMDRAGDESVYLVDVRTEEEFARGHIPGFCWFPGGQAVQRSDDLVAVRNGRVVFCCDGTARSTITASWYRQMGFPNVYSVAGGVTAWRTSGLELETGMAEEEPFGLDEARGQVNATSPGLLEIHLADASDPLVIHVGTSREFANGHLPGARWLSRSWLELRIGEFVSDKSTEVIVTDEEGTDAILAGATLNDLGYSKGSVLIGGTGAWSAAGFPVEQGLSGVMTPPDDVLVMGPERGFANMVEYLRWEVDLGKKYS